RRTALNKWKSLGGATARQPLGARQRELDAHAMHAPRAPERRAPWRENRCGPPQQAPHVQVLPRVRRDRDRQLYRRQKERALLRVVTSGPPKLMLSPRGKKLNSPERYLLRDLLADQLIRIAAVYQEKQAEELCRNRRAPHPKTLLESGRDRTAHAIGFETWSMRRVRRPFPLTRIGLPQTDSSRRP